MGFLNYHYTTNHRNNAGLKWHPVETRMKTLMKTSADLDISKWTEEPLIFKCKTAYLQSLANLCRRCKIGPQKYCFLSFSFISHHSKMKRCNYVSVFYIETMINFFFEKALKLLFTRNGLKQNHGHPWALLFVQYWLASAHLYTLSTHCYVKHDYDSWFYFILCIYRLYNMPYKYR